MSRLHARQVTAPAVAAHRPSVDHVAAVLAAGPMTAIEITSALSQRASRERSREDRQDPVLAMRALRAVLFDHPTHFWVDRDDRWRLRAGIDSWVDCRLLERVSEGGRL